jgi:hypothetical protein
VKVTDFGLASVATEPWRLTASGVLLGTPAYMSPEQAAFSAVDHRSDLFSLGSVLYELCTGGPPFPGPTVKTILTGVREAEPRPIRDVNADIPVALEHVIRRLMAKDPAERYESARDLVGVLADELAEIQGRSRKPPRDGEEQESRPPERPGAAVQDGHLDLVDSWDDVGSSPRHKGHSATGTPAAWARSIARRSLVIIGAAMVITIVALATISIFPTVWRDFGNDAPIIILLLAFTGIAVVTWSLAQLVTAVRRPAAAGPAKGRRVGSRRPALAAVMLLPAAGAAWAEWSAHLMSRRALNAVNARLEKSSGIVPLSREEVETLLGRTADDLSVSQGGTHLEVNATYRWRGVFRTYYLRARYLRPKDNPRDPRPKPRDDEGRFDKLDYLE